MLVKVLASPEGLGGEWAAAGSLKGPLEAPKTTKRLLGGPWKLLGEPANHSQSHCLGFRVMTL